MLISVVVTWTVFERALPRNIPFHGINKCAFDSCRNTAGKGQLGLAACPRKLKFGREPTKLLILEASACCNQEFARSR